MDPGALGTELEVDDLSSRLSENMAIVFTEQEIQEARAEFEQSLVIKLAGNKGCNRTVFKEVLRNSWRVGNRVRFVEVENNILVAKFEDKEDMERVQRGGPWRYMGWAVLVERWIPGREMEELFSNRIQIWVQIHNLPVELRKDKFAIRFAERAGRVVRSGSRGEGESSKDERRVFARFLVEVDVSRPVVPGWKLDRPGEKPLWVEFRYERLPNICFQCGSFCHEASHCTERRENGRDGKFGPWLRAEHIAIERLQGGGRSHRKPKVTGEGDRSSRSLEDSWDRYSGEVGKTSTRVGKQILV